MSGGVDVVDNLEVLQLCVSRLEVSQAANDISQVQEFSLSNSLELQLETSQVCIEDKEKKKSKTRRRLKKKNKKKDIRVEVNECVTETVPGEDDAVLFSEMSNHLTIQAMRSQRNAVAIRKRNEKCHYIKLYTFTKSYKPLVFVSRPCRKLAVERNIVDVDDHLCQAAVKATPKNGIFTKTRDVPVKNDKVENLQSSTSQGKKKQHRKRLYINSSLETKGPKFEDYLKYEDVDEGLFLGRLIKGVLRINPKNSKNAYVSNADRSSHDYMINSELDRNRALEGDVVALKLKPESEWKENHKAATIVYIIEQVHPRTVIGTLTEFYDRGKKVVVVQPRDKRVPRVAIPKTSLPPLYLNNPKDQEDVLFLAKIVEWTNPKFATGVILDTIGECGNLKAETKAILLEHQLDVTSFPSSVEKYLPKSSEIPAEELQVREDLRKDCIFTIDPLTARDLDDAVSCKELPNGNLEVGVHISDVTYFLDEGTELDKMVCQKGTTIYLVDNVYHMLPVEMCFHCSLLPGKDSLAFSVFWEMTREGEILNHRFARTVINSCCQLAYEHAQKMIDDPESFNKSQLPDIHNSFDASKLSEIVNSLGRIARNLRQKRFDSGALKIDQVKLVFRLDAAGEPSEYLVYENQESHRLIEEFMLLANITTAQKILNELPDLAFLRCHEPPNPRLIAEVQQKLEILGIHIDINSSGSLHSSLQTYSTPDYLGSTRMAVLYHLLAKPMTRAKYFCASHPSVDDFHHFALSIPIYTHFTSPIRRYADIMVHRLLAASLGYREKPTWEADHVLVIAENCNRQKYNAKRAGEASCDLYLAHYVETHQPFVRDAVVVDVRERSFDVLVLDTGSIVRMFANNLGEEVKSKSEHIGEEKKLWRMCISYPAVAGSPVMRQVIELFQIVKVNLSRKDKTNSLKGEIVRPDSTLIRSDSTLGRPDSTLISPDSTSTSQ